jgi:hypothetical protein
MYRREQFNQIIFERSINKGSKAKNIFEHPGQLLYISRDQIGVVAQKVVPQKSA